MWMGGDFTARAALQKPEPELSMGVYEALCADPNTLAWQVRLVAEL